MKPEPLSERKFGKRADLLVDIAGYVAVGLVIYVLFAFAGGLR